MNPEPKSLKEAKLLLAEQEQIIVDLQAQIAENAHLKDNEAGNAAKKYLEAFFNNTVDIVTLAEADTQRIIKANTVATKLLGYTEEELLQRHIYDLDNGRNKANVAKNIKEIISAGQRVFEVQHRTKSGELIDLLANVRPVKIAQKTHILSLYTNISYLKSIERLAQENLQKYSELVNSIDGIIWEADIKTWHFTYLSQQAERLLGYTPEEWMNDADFWVNHIHPDDLKNTLAYTKKQRDLKKSYSHEYRFIAADGSIFWLRDIVSLILDEAGEIDLLRGVMIDVTYLKKIERQNQENLKNHNDLVNSIDGIIWETNAKTSAATYINERVESILGYSVEEWLNTPNFWASHIHPEDQSWVIEQAITNTQNKEPYDLKYRFIAADGRTVWVHDIVTIKLDELGSPHLLRGVIIDITRQKEIEESLQQSENRYRQMFEHNKAIKFLVDPENGAFLDANPAAVEFYGYTLDEFKSMTAYDLNPFAPESVKEALTAASNEQQAYFQFQHQLKSGEARNVEVYSGPITYGEKIVLYSIVHDITDRRQKEQEIQDLTETLEQRVGKRTSQLQEINQELEAFAYSISHDLRAPLRAITGYSNILHADFSEELPAQAQEYLQRIDQASKKMDRLINDLLMLSRLGRQTLRIHEINYCEMTKRIFAEQIKSFPDRNFSITTCKTCPNINADPKLLEIMVSNLIANAIKFTKMRETPQIEFGAIENNDEEVIYFIKDNGIGFNMDYADKLFSAFQRLHSETEFEGTGIGLAIAKRVIQRHNGRIWVESEPDKGTTFYFTIGENLTI